MKIPFVDIHTHKKYEDNPFIFSYMAGSGEPLPLTPYSTAVHPWKLTGAQQEWLDGSITPLTVAIGETGLDFNIKTPKEEQEKWFRLHLSKAQELSLPVIIHCVKAYNQVMEIAGEYGITPVIHGFTGSPELAVQLTGKGFYLSFGENLLRSPKTQDALKATPPDRIFLETDESSINIKNIYEAAAEITGRYMNEIKNNVYNNYRKVFLRDE